MVMDLYCYLELAFIQETLQLDNGEIILTGALSSSTDLTIAATGTLDLRADQTFNTLTISGAGTGNRIENGDSNTIGSLTVTNAATLAGNIVTIGSQTYSGAVTLGANTSVQVSGRTTSSTTTETYGEGGDSGNTEARTYTVNISSSQTLTRIELIGAGGGDGGTDSGNGNSTTTGPAGRYIVDIELTNTTIRVAPGGGGNDGGNSKSADPLRYGYATAPTGGVNTLNSNFNGGDSGQAGFSGTSGQGGSGGAASIVEIVSGSGDYIVAGGAGGGGGAGNSSPFSNTSGTGTYSANGTSTTGADGLQAVTVDPVGGNADGGGSGGGGGGYYGGAAGALVYKEGTDGNNDTNDIDGLGGSRGGNGVIDADSSLTYTEITDGTSSVSSGSKGKVILTYAGPNSAISFGSTINGNYTLNTSTGGGDVTFTGATGVDTPINGLTVSAGDFDASTIALQNSAAVSITITGTSSDVAAITGTSATLTKAGTGTLTLTGANTYSGATTINAGTLKATGTLSDSTAITVASGATYDFDATDTVGSIAGAGTINIASSQTLSAGNDNSTTDFSGVIEGAGAFTKVGSGSLTLTGDNTSTGTYTVSAGTLVLNDADGDTGTVLSDSASVTVDGGDLSLLDTSGETVATFTVTQGNVTGTFLTASSYVFNPDTGETATVGSVISGSSGLTMSGAGTLVLTAANTFTGNITISAGTLKIDGTGTLEEGDYDGTISNAGTLHYSSTTDQILRGVISSTGALTKDETSTLTLSAANTYTGATTIDAGTLTVSGTLSDSTDVDNSGIYDVDATDTIQSLTGTGAVQIASGQTLTTGDTGNDEISGIISGAGNLTKAGSGILTLAATNTYTGTTTISAGTLKIDEAGSLESGNYDGTISNSGTFIYSSTADQILAGVISGTGALTKEENSILTLTATNTYTGLTTVSAGTLTLDQASNTTGTVIKDTNAVTVNGGILNLADTTETIGALTLTSGSITGTNKTLTGSSYTLNPGDGVSVSIQPILAGSGNLTKSAAGTATLSAANTYTGTTTISDGTLTVTGTLSDSTAVTNNGTYNLNATDTITIGSLAGSGTVSTTTSGIKIFTVGDDDSSTTFSGTIENGSGSIVLIKSGSGTLTLSGANTFSGGSALTSQSGSFGAPDTGPLTVTQTYLTAFSTDVDTLPIITSLVNDIAQYRDNFSTRINSTTNTNFQYSIYRIDDDSLTQSWGAIDGTSTYNVYPVGVTINEGTLKITNDSSINSTDAIRVNSSAVFDISNVAISNPIRLDGGTLTNSSVSASSTSGGVIVTDSSTVTGTGNITLSGQVNLPPGEDSRLDISLTKTGTNRLILSGDNFNETNTDYNLYTGLTILDNGSFELAHADAIDISRTADPEFEFDGGTLRFSSSFIEDISAAFRTGANQVYKIDTNGEDVTFATALTSSGGTLEKLGTGTLTLSATNTYTGTTTITEGTLQVTGLLADTVLSVASGATYDVDQTDTIGSISGAGNVDITGVTLTVGGDNADKTLTGNIVGTNGNLIKTGTGTLTLQGTNTYTGATTVNNGTLTISGTGKLGNGNYAGTLIVASGKTFNYSSSSAQTFSDWGAGTGTINLSGGDTVTLSGDQNFTGTLNVSQMLAMTNGTNGSETGLGKATTIDIQSGGTIKVQSSDNGFIGYQTSGAPDIYIRDGGELTTDDTDTARTFHIGGTLTLDGGTLSWEEGTGNTISTADGTWNFDQDVVVTESSTISAPALLSKEADGDTTFTVSATKTLTVSGYFYDGSGHTEVAVEKAGDGTMILEAAGTHPAAFTVTAGTLAVTANNALGTTAAETTVASGATLDFRGVTYSTTEAITNNGGTIATSSETSTFAGVITLGANSIFDVGGTQLTVSGVIQDDGAGGSSFGITKNGNGKLILSGANTYDGTTAIADGSLRAQNDTALGTTASGTTVASGAALELNDLDDGTAIAIGAEALSLAGTGISNGGALRNIAGNNSYAGAITLTADTRINSDSGTLTLNVASGASITGTFNLTFGGAGNITVSDAITTGTGTLTKDGTGTLTLAGNNTYTGATTISDGIVAITHANALGKNGETLSTTTVSDGATLSISHASTINVPEPITISGTGVLNAGAIQFTGSGANTYSGAIILGANATISSIGSGGTTFGGTINASSSGAQSLTISTSTDDLTISGVIGGTTRPSTIDISATGVSKTLSIDQDLSSTGNQTLTAAGGITISGARTFTSTSGTINTVSALSGNSSFDISGNADIDGAITGITTFSVSGTSDLSADVTTSSTQTYTGAVTLGANITLTGTVINTQSTLGNYSVSAQGTSGWLDANGDALSDTRTYDDSPDGDGEVTILSDIQYANYQISSLASNNYTVSFEFYRINSWDSTDILEIYINDTKIFEDNFYAFNSETRGLDRSQTLNSYTTTFVNRVSDGDVGDYIRFSGDSGSSWNDASYDVTITTTAITSLDLELRDGLNESVVNESFGVRNFAISDGGTAYALTVDGNLDADGDVNLTSLSVTGTSSLNGDVTSSSTQDYTGNVTVDSDITLTTTDSQITFTGTVNSEATEANDLTISVGTSEVEFDSAVGGGISLGAIGITGALDLDAAITSASSLSVSTTSNLGADVTTSGTQTYTGAVTTAGSRTLQGSTVQFASTVTGTTAATDDLTITGALDLDGAITDINDLYVSGTSDLGANITTTGTQEYNNNVTLSGAARTLTTSGDTVTFTGTVNGAQDLTVDTNGTDNGSSLATVLFSSTVGDTTPVGAVLITGNLDLNADILQSDSTAGATSINVSGTSNLGASVTTTGDQTYTGAVTLSANNTLTTTSNGSVSFVSTTDSDATDRTLAITTNGTGDVSFTGAVGGTGGLNGLTIDTNQFNAAALTVGGTISITNTDTASSEITGVIANDGDAAVFTKAGTGTLVLSGTNTSTGLITVSAGTLTLDQDSNTTGTVIANSTAITVNGGILNLADNTETVGAVTLTSGSITGTSKALTGSSYSINPADGTTVTVSANLAGSGINLTKTEAGIYTTSGSHTYTGTTTLTAGTILAGVASSGSVGSITSSAIGVGIFIVNGGTISSDGATARTFYNPVTFTGNGTFGHSTNTGTLTFEAVAELGAATRTLTVNASTITEFSDVIGDSDAGDYGITKAGAGTLILSGANDYTGDTTVSAGVLTAAHNTALGTTAGNTSVASGAALELSGGIALAAGEDITLVGTGISSGGALRNISGNNSIAGLVTLSGTTRINSDSDTLTFDVSAGNAITGTNTAVTFGGSGNITVNDPIGTGSGTLTKDGTGTLTLTAANTYTGKTTISNGTIVVSGSGTIGNGASALDIAGTGTLDLQNTSTTGTLTILAAGTGERITNSSDATSQLTTSDASSLTGEILTSGIDVIFNNTVTLTGNTVINSPNITFNYAVSGGTYNLDIGKSGEGAGNLTVNAEITNVGNLTVLGTTVIDEDISTVGNQIYHGAVTVDDDEDGSAYWTLTTTNDNITFNGTLNSTSGEVNNLTFNTGGNTGTITFGDATADTVGATDGLGALAITGKLDLNAAITSATSISVSGTSNLGANVTTSGTQTYTGAVTLSANTIITTTDNDVSFGATIARDGTARNLTLNTGTGTVSVTGNVGSGAALGIITLTQTGGTTFSGTLDAATVTLTDTADATDITFSGSATIATLNTAAQPYNIVFNGAANTITNLVTFTNTGTVTLGNSSSDSSTFNGGITATAPSGVTLAGTIQTSGDTISIGDGDTAITLAANTIVDGNTAGDITLAGATNGGYSLTLNTTGTTTLSAEIGGSTALTTLTTNASGTTVISADIETSSTQTYNDAVTLSADVTLTTTDSNLTFNGTVNSTDATNRALTINLDGNGGGTSADVIFGNGTADTIGVTYDLGAIAITGDLDLNAAIGNGATAGATSLSVSGTTNIGANITTTTTQTFTGAVTLSVDTTLRGTTIYTQSTVSGSGGGTSVSTTGTTGWIDQNGNAFSSINGTGGITYTFNNGAYGTDDEGDETILCCFNNAANSAKAHYTDITGLNNTSATVTFKFYNFDSWDDEYFYIYNGTTLIASRSFNKNSASSKYSDSSHSNNGYTTTFENREGNSSTLLNLGGDGDFHTSSVSTSFADSSFLITIVTPAISTFDLRLSDNLGDGRIYDESWGVANFTLTASANSSLTITGNLEASGAISDITSLSVSGTSSLNGDVTSSSTQGYTGNVTVANDITLTTTNSQITFTGTVNSEATEANDLTISVGTSEVEFDSAVGGGTDGALGAIGITGALDLDADITSASSLSVSTTSNLGANVTTSGTQTYTGAVTLSADVVLTTTNNNVTFSSTIDSDDASTKRDLTLTLGSGSASVTGIVGATSLDVLTLNSSSSFTAAVTATSIVNAVSKTATFSDAVTANITNSGTLLFDTSANKSVTGTIAEPGGGATGTEIKVIDSADGAPATVTFTATIAADTLTVGTSSKAGAALFQEAVTVPTINITGGDVDAEDSTATFNKAVTSFIRYHFR
jgi:autotransporter-associated beta strand protein